ncbi:MAG: PAS domain S-box protein [Proteobacteria bacterium]|nr:PAS domain S-box protein [Pseudomonadota bacterium]
MSVRRYSLVPDPPRGFEPISLSDFDSLEGSVAVFAGSVDDVLSRRPEFTEQVDGLVITVGAEQSHVRIGPDCWHLTVPDVLLPELADLVDYILDMVGKSRAKWSFESQHSETLLAHFASAVDASSDAIGFASPTGVHFYQNAAFTKLLGKIGDNQPVSAYVDEDIGRKIFKTTMEGRKWTGEVRMYDRDGHVIDVFLRTYATRNKEGKITCLVGLHTDITERKKAEKEVQKLVEVVRHSRDLINLADLEGNMIFLNEAGSNMLGIDPANIENVSILQVIPDHLMELVHTELLPALTSGNDWKGDLQYLNQKTGKLTDVHAITFAVKDPETGTTQFLANVSQDITKRKQDEKELQRLRDNLGEIIDSSPSMIVCVDQEGKVTQWNSTAVQTIGVSAEEAVGQPLDKVFPRLANVMPLVCQAISSGMTQMVARKARPGEDKPRIEDILVYPLISGGIGGAVIRVDDVTERVRLDEIMVQSEKMLSVGGLAAGMAHEINNPLAGIMQTADVLVNRLTGDLPGNTSAAEKAGTTMEVIRTFMQARNVPKMLDNIQSSGNRAATIVSDMLSFARKSHSSFAPHDLAELLDQTVSIVGSDYDLKKKYDFRQIEIIRQYEEDLPRVRCESGKIQQVMFNLLRNGAEAMHDASGKDKTKQSRFVLRLAHEKISRMVRIEIEDNGPGMDAAIRKRVFEPFYTTKSPNQGTGLGLSVSYFIITDTHGGEIGVESTLGKGANFIIKLPV